jgi:hypothetical protein
LYGSGLFGSASAAFVKKLNASLYAPCLEKYFPRSRGDALAAGFVPEAPLTATVFDVDADFGVTADLGVTADFCVTPDFGITADDGVAADGGVAADDGVAADGGVAADVDIAPGFGNEL